jgi:hypothetical protein
MRPAPGERSVAISSSSPVGQLPNPRVLQWSPIKRLEGRGSRRRCTSLLHHGKPGQADSEDASCARNVAHAENSVTCLYAAARNRKS